MQSADEKNFRPAPEKDILAPSSSQTLTATGAPGGAPFFRFLIAEDNQVNQEVIMDILKLLCNCEIDIVGNGREAVRAWSGSSYTLILMDCQMPEMDGYQASGLIREGEQAASEAETEPHTPIIALTGYTTADAREQCLAAGMDDFLPKPFTVNELKFVLDRWLPGYTVAADNR